MFKKAFDMLSGCNPLSYKEKPKVYLGAALLKEAEKLEQQLREKPIEHLTLTDLHFLQLRESSETVEVKP